MFQTLMNAPSELTPATAVVLLGALPPAPTQMVLSRAAVQLDSLLAQMASLAQVCTCKTLPHFYKVWEKYSQKYSPKYQTADIIAFTP